MNEDGLTYENLQERRRRRRTELHIYHLFRTLPPCARPLSAASPLNSPVYQPISSNVHPQILPSSFATSPFRKRFESDLGLLEWSVLLDFSLSADISSSVSLISLPFVEIRFGVEDLGRVEVPRYGEGERERKGVVSGKIKCHSRILTEPCSSPGCPKR
jgi:hypothetical protein